MVEEEERLPNLVSSGWNVSSDFLSSESDLQQNNYTRTHVYITRINTSFSQEDLFLCLILTC